MNHTSGPALSPLSAATRSLRNINTHEALVRFGGDEQRYWHWLVEFVDHGPAANHQIRQSISNGSRDAAIQLTHALKGRTGMLGMDELHSIAQTLEKALSNGEPTAIWLEELETSTREMVAEISSALKHQEEGAIDTSRARET